MVITYQVILNFPFNIVLLCCAIYFASAAEVILSHVQVLLMRSCFLHGHLLNHWGWVTYICISKVPLICSGNGFSPVRRQAIIWSNAGILLIGPLGTNFSEILIEIHTFSFKKMHLKMLSGKWRPFCLCLNVLTCWDQVTAYDKFLMVLFIS